MMRNENAVKVAALQTCFIAEDLLAIFPISYQRKQ